MSELFIEIGAEEIPARFIGPALEALAAGVVKLLAGIEHGRVVTWGTPRRLAVGVSNVDVARASVARVITGPPAAQAFVNGEPGPVAIAFAKSKGVDPSQLDVVPGPKGDVVAARVVQGGERTRDVVAAGLEALVTGIPFKKSMRWGSSPWRFARPVHRVCCVLGGDLVDTTVMGLSTTDTSVGHWLLAPEPFPVTDGAHWLASLRSRWVMADIGERRRVVRDLVEDVAVREGATVRVDDALLDEVTNLVEWPSAVVGEFPAALLDLPPRLLVESMKVNQRYFPLYQGGALSNRFVVITNNPHGDGELIAAGNARVLAARFLDARFFYSEDRKRPLEAHGERLAGMTWVKGLGTMADRRSRLVLAARGLAPLCGANPEDSARAAGLAKCDLTTQMVGEFPELQGHVGRLLAESDGESRAVTLAIEEHYLPRFAGDALPETPEGRAVALADRIVLLVGAHAVGLAPTASADPQGLRRAAVGLVQILLAGGTSGDLHGMFASAGQPAGEEVIEFVLGRARALLIAEGNPPDLVDAVGAVGGSDIVRLATRVRAVGALARDGTFAPIRATFRRVAGLVKEHTSAEYRLDLFEGEPEYQLHLALARVPAAEADVSTILAALTDLRPVVDRFFDGVLVMCDDLVVRANRLGLLRAIVDRFGGFADFSRLSGE